MTLDDLHQQYAEYRTSAEKAGERVMSYTEWLEVTAIGFSRRIREYQVRLGEYQLVCGPTGEQTIEFDDPLKVS